MIRNLAALISLTVVFSGSLSLSTESVDAKTSDAKIPDAKTPDAKTSEARGSELKGAEAKTVRNSSGRARNYFVPPPPPYTPSMVPSALGTTNAQAVTADADDAVVEKPVNRYSKYIFTRNHDQTPQVVQPNPQVVFDQGVEKRILKRIDSIDSDISSIQKEIGKLLNL